MRDQVGVKPHSFPNTQPIRCPGRKDSRCWPPSGRFIPIRIEAWPFATITVDAASVTVGERGVVDLIGVMGYYHLVSMALNVDRYPLPAGVKPELGPLPAQTSR